MAEAILGSLDVIKKVRVSDDGISIAEEQLLKTRLPMEIDSGAAVENLATAEDWRKALSRVVPAVVVLRTTACRAFDTEPAGSGYATGFIVDKKRGIILTNRHVVKPGPIVAEAVFLNREEIPVHPLYRDPVHDFGFLHFDPGAVQFLEYEEIPFAPEAASVGLEIRVVGNDSGEKVSILSGTIARLDRDAPPYKRDGYNDFNTFYMQVVRALKFFQEDILESSLSKNSWQPVHIPRGTLQMTLMHKGFDETRRLGLKRETEQMVRQASPSTETGMLVVDSVVPGGPSHKLLEPGDVLVLVNGEVVTQFLRLEVLLDDNVGKHIDIELERGGATITVTLLIQDLHSITPNFFLEVSGGVVHPLSYQQARNFRFTCGLVYVADPGYMLSRAGVPKHAIIKKLAGEETSVLDDFIAVYSKLSRGARVPLEFLTYVDRHRSKSVLVTVDRHEWYAPPQLYVRDDSTGLWNVKPAISTTSAFSLSLFGSSNGEQQQLLSTYDNISTKEGSTVSVVNGVEKSCEGEATGSSGESVQASDAPIIESETKRRRVNNLLGGDGLANTDGTSDHFEHNIADNEVAEETVTIPASSASTAEHVIEPTLVMMEVHIPPSAMLDGVHAQHFFGTGVIVHHSQSLGLVAVDRNTVAISVSDVMLSFAAYPIEIPAEVVFLHPVHNFALVAYDPAALGSAGAAAVRAATLLSEPPLSRGDAVYLVGLNRSLQATSRKSVVTNPSVALNVGAADCPRYRAMNMEVIEVDTGVLADELGRVQALWASFSTQWHFCAHLEHHWGEAGFYSFTNSFWIVH
ncbi:hypothetical protein O6H91_01G108300 [Diphasiastrum complanatum]|uniref:Uncharacterized protein n=1 Tax=Diphasiastrum complanatum TaxID=34168 RepID=A0ACC2EUF7_DIPCM|nr:hypothetical protein O6H91_01G108300 [Diphasiastrum complanatum]